MSIGQGIVGVLSFLLKLYKIIIPQDFQLMRNGGFGHIQKDRQVTYTHFVAVQCLHNTASGIITEDLKEFGHTLSLIFRHDVFLHMFQKSSWIAAQSQQASVLPIMYLLSKRLRIRSTILQAHYS